MKIEFDKYQNEPVDYLMCTHSDTCTKFQMSVGVVV